jgi:hypothetical protein
LVSRRFGRGFIASAGGSEERHMRPFTAFEVFAFIFFAPIFFDQSSRTLMVLLIYLLW